MTGAEIQNLIKKERLFQWEVAEKLKINEFTLSRWLRSNLSEDKEKAILEAIEILSQKD